VAVADACPLGDARAAGELPGAVERPLSGPWQAGPAVPRARGHVRRSRQEPRV